MKLMEVVLGHLKTQVGVALDPLEFAYRPHVGVEDADAYLLYKAYSYLQMAGNTVIVMFFDVSRDFNTIQALLPRDKLSVAYVNSALVSWITDYLTATPHYDDQYRCCMRNCSCSFSFSLFTLLTLGII